MNSEDILFFENQEAFRAWLAANHATATSITVGFHKVGSGKPSLSWSDSVDVALCFGWIDGVRKSLGEQSYQIRFTPRRPNSIWSNVNLKKVEELIAANLMMPSGLAAYQQRNPAQAKKYSFENAEAEFGEPEESHFGSHPEAYAFFSAQAPSYRKMIRHWIMQAKQPETRMRRLQKLIETSRTSKRLDP